MRWRGFLSALVVLATPAALAAAETPTPATTAFDGKYVGTGTESRARFITIACPTMTSVYMTITGGQVMIHEIFFDGGARTYRGSVNAVGEVLALSQTPTMDTLSGTIHEKVFTGHHLVGAYCSWNIKLAPAPAPTLPFDGEYIGVSRESSKTTSATGAACPANGVPVPLSIWNGVVWSDRPFWLGTVNAQGVLAMRTRHGTQVEGQIDSQGIIRGQAPNAAGCAVIFVWRKQSG